MKKSLLAHSTELNSNIFRSANKAERKHTKISAWLICLLLLGGVFGANAQTYCSSTYSTVEAINRVVVAGIDKSSSGGGGYENFLSTSGTMVPGGSYPITVWGNTAGNYTCYITVWIDFNNDGTFSNINERFYIGYFTNNSNGSCSNTITVPTTGVVSANTRMRVSKNYNAYQTDPCASGSYGQVEDYTIIIPANTF
ncbi:MAG: GEVED domain-containing protein, partial [Chitinophagales bacterium]|nr:GEVED domain-containing protein [Chitinophagales bacterium]